MSSRYFVCSLCLIFSVFAFGFFVPVSGQASEEYVSITVNKRLWDKAPEQLITNTGERMDVAGVPLEKAGFSLYDVTAMYRELRKNHSMEEAITSLQTQAAAETFIKTQIGQEQFTDSNGQTTFQKVAMKAENQYRVYLLLETTIPDQVKAESAVPIVLALPLYQFDENGQTMTDNLLTDIQVYPKNVGNQEQPPAKPEEPETPSVPVKPKKPIHPIFPQTGEMKSMIGLIGILVSAIAGAIWATKRLDESKGK